MGTVVKLRVDAVELSHSSREIPLRRFDYYMIVIIHQTVRVAQPVKTVDNPAQRLKERLTITIIIEDVLSCIAAGGHVV